MKKSKISLFKSFPFVLALNLFILNAFKKTLGNIIRIVFSQTGEDLILKMMLDDKKGVFYLDVGCNDPVYISNTMNMYMEGGRGICIDANEELTTRFKKKRPRDIVINAAISDVEEELIFHIADAKEVSTMDSETYKEWSKEWAFSREIIVQTQTLNNILEKNLPEVQTIDVLSIDVEGYDFKVLKSIDLRKYRPRIILIEIHDLDLSDESFRDNDIIKHLFNYDYDLKYYATMNAYFVDKNQ